MKTKLKVVQDDEEVVERDVLATAIVTLSDGVRKLLDGGMTERAIVVLLADCTAVRKGDIWAVLRGLKELKTTYTTR